MNRSELYKLLSALNDGTISAEDHARLDETLELDATAREIYYDYTDVHLQLHRQFSSHDPLTPTATLPTGATKASSPSQLASHRRWSAWTHLAAIAATILGVLAFQQMRGDKHSQKASSIIAEPVQAEPSPSYIATLSKSADCIWEGEHRPKFDGQRLLTNQLHLKEGIAEFRFDAGVRIVMEGPAFLEIESAASALLSSGRVVLHGSEMASPFSLHTPVTTLRDIGTEYGVEVEPEGTTEVHVFDGEVSVLPRAESIGSLAPQHMTVGQASRFDTAGSISVELATTRFKHKVPESSLPTMRSKDAILAYDGFNYDTPLLGNSNGGSGWSGPWRNWYGRQDPSVSILHHASDLGFGPCLRVMGKKNVSWRTFKTPVRLDADGVYYFSFLLKKISEVERGKSQYGALELRTADFPKDDFKLSFGMSSERHVSLTHNKQQLLSAPPIPSNVGVRFVVKIVAGQDAPDQVMVRWYGPEESFGDTEPHIWSCVSQPEYGDAVFSQLAIRAGGDAAYLVDELRLGTKWTAITDNGPKTVDHN